MLWKVLEALAVLGRYGRKALGSFDVNMVCPLPGSWINHVCIHVSASVRPNGTNLNDQCNLHKHDSAETIR